MEATPSSGRIGGKFSGNPLSGRRGGILVAVAAAVLAGVLLYAFVQHYRKNTPAPVATSNSVVVASAYIARGTPVSMAEAANSFRRASLGAASVVPGAITDPSVIAGEVATQNIAPGQQLTAADF